LYKGDYERERQTDRQRERQRERDRVRDREGGGREREGEREGIFAHLRLIVSATTSNLLDHFLKDRTSIKSQTIAKSGFRTAAFAINLPAPSRQDCFKF
jgi:hypothetical protein